MLLCNAVATPTNTWNNRCFSGTKRGGLLRSRGAHAAAAGGQGHDVGPDQLASEVQALAGFNFNIGSTAQV